MATENAPKKQSGWDKVVAWYARQAYAVGIVYSLGAAVVIVGALFKIMHWPGAGIVLTAGMCTEAFLFMIGIFEKPHATYHWEHVFPQLVGDETKELLGGNGVAGVAGSAQTSSAPAAPALTEGDMRSLKEGIENLGRTAGQLSELGKVAVSTTNLVGKMDEATKAVEQFAGSQAQLVANSDKLNGKYSQLGSVYEQMQAEAEKMVEATRSQQRNVEGINNQLGSLNAVYELQLSALKSQADALKGQTERINANNSRIEAVAADMQKMQENMKSAANGVTAYEDGVKKLSTQIADLNKIYGNMLNALA